MVHVTLKQLRYFDALARELHFGRAAEACSVTQPALSMQIQELEHSLGLALVERTRLGVQLTGRGADLAQRAARVLGEVRDFIEFATHGADTLSGVLRLGVIPSVAPYILPPLLPVAREAFPELELQIRETQTHTLLQELVDGKLDLLFLALPVKHQDVETQELFKDKFVAALPKDRQIKGRVKAAEDLVADQRLLLLEEGHCLRDQALAYCSLQEVRAFTTFGASSLSTIVEMVGAGLGITLLPEISLGVETRGRKLNLMRFETPEPARELGLAWRTTSPRKDEFREFGELIMRASADLIENAKKLAPNGARRRTTKAKACSA